MNRLKFINQKRTTLKAQLTNFEKLIAEDRYDDANIRLRLKRITELFHAYEEFHDELAILEPSEDHSDEFDEIQNRYYVIASRFEKPAQPSTSREVNLNTTSIAIDNNTRRIKLPVTELPKFDGSLDKWLSFKNTFVTMIDSLQDITDLQKFLYLKDSLRGAALNKISMYDVSEENYKNAWKLLNKSYERKRILIARHLDAILELPTQNKPDPQNLTKLIDDMQQHVNMLASLGVQPDQHLLIRIIERALPTEICAKWEETLSLDVSPTLEQLYEFISETAFRICDPKRDAPRFKNGGNGKRPHSQKETSAAKTRKDDFGARALVTNTTSNCSLCKGEKHALYKCPEFMKLSVSGRWDFIKKTKFCRNCLRTHIGNCRWSRCRICNKPHNSLLHNPSFKSTAGTPKIENNNSTGQTSTGTSKSD
ncbi:uncharacterized protein LOC118645351 [Monomorium pharaonis]|uniref:uncharacterized protein LOC118645351 n=1 Tax=Monomorium pharaonis TaxID=307658 RepID=UPI0017478E77|nr:uncharacterized protein LOC118645351 [Monomorium pharaonis]